MCVIVCRASPGRFYIVVFVVRKVLLERFQEPNNVITPVERQVRSEQTSALHNAARDTNARSLNVRIVLGRRPTNPRTLNTINLHNNRAHN